MKYNKKTKPLVCLATQGRCYKETWDMEVKGVLWHSTGAPNPTLKRYVQPSDITPEEDTYSKEKWLELLGVNEYNNHWNGTLYDSNGNERWAGLNGWVGMLEDGTVTSVQTMPWSRAPWGCGTAYDGGPSCNDGWIQFEICEDGLTDEEYFKAVYLEACELTAYLCKLFNIDPTGTVTFHGKEVPTILCHADSHYLGLGCNHGDVYHWFTDKFGYTMDNVRSDVSILMEGEELTLDDLSVLMAEAVVTATAESTFTDGQGGSESTPEETPTQNSIKKDASEELLLEFVNFDPTEIESQISNFILSSLSPNSIEATFNTKSNFDKFKWTYTLINLKKSDDSRTSDLTVTDKAPKITITDINSGTCYSLEIMAESKANSENKYKSQKLYFSTPYLYPKNVENFTITLDLNKTDQCNISFDASNTWEGLSTVDKGYRIILTVNGEEVSYNDALIPSLSVNKITNLSIDLTTLFKFSSLEQDDVVQIGIVPWIKDNQGICRFSNQCIRYSQPFYLINEHFKVSNLRVKIQDNFKLLTLHAKK